MAGKGFAKTLAVSLGGAVIGALAAFAVAAVVGRLLGPSGAGIFFQFVAIFTIAMTMLKLGADTGLVRTVAQLKILNRSSEIPGAVKTAVVPVLIVSAVLGALAFIAAPLLGDLITADPTQVETATQLVRYLTPLVIFGALMYLLLGALRGLGSLWGYVGILNIALPLLRLVLVAAVLLAGGSALWAVIAWAGMIPVWCGAAALLLVASLRKVRRESSAPTPVGEGRQLGREFWSFSLGRWAAATVEIVLDWVDVLLVGALLSPAAAGIYAVATRVVRAGQVVDNAMRVAVGPRISERMALHDTDGVHHLFGSASKAMLVLTLPFYVTCLVFADTILGFFGAGFQVGADALRVLAAGMIVSAATIMSQSIILMAGRSTWQLRNKSIALAVVVAGNLILVPHWGIIGAATAWASGICVDAFLVTRQTATLLGPRKRAKAILLPLVSVGGGIAAIGLGVRLLAGAAPIHLGLHLAAVCLAYAVGLLIAVRVFRFSASDLIGSGSRSQSVAAKPPVADGAPQPVAVPRD